MQFISQVLLCICLLFVLPIKAQITRVKGKVVNEHQQPLPFVNVSFKNSNIGTTTDFNGKFSIQTKWATDSLSVSFLGYQKSTQFVQKGKAQTLNYRLYSTSVKLENVTIIENKKVKYRNKNNPAVELIRKVIDNKKFNQKQSLDYYEYDKYEKIQFDINNFSDKLADRKFMRDFDFIFDNYVDTSEINGKPYIPFFIREKSSKIYFRKQPKSEKEYLLGTKMSGSLNRFDNDGIGHFMNKLYSEVNIYDNQIELFGNKFPSPINDLAPTIYKFFIIDTVIINQTECINIGFSPRSKSDFAFTGNLYVLNDSSYAIRQVELGVNNAINLNFVNDLKITQDYENVESHIWLPSKNTIFIDYSFGNKQMGVVGKKSVSHKNFILHRQRADTIYQTGADIVKLNENTDEQFWTKNRHQQLTKDEQGIYEMIDSIQSTRSFKIIAEASSILTSGWIDANWYELGTVASFISWNKIEGLKLRMGARTTPDYNKKYQIGGHLAIGLGDLRLKYRSEFLYSFNKHYIKYPQHHIYSSISRTTHFPGQYSENISQDNFLYSFNSNASDKMIMTHNMKIDYLREFKNGLSFGLTFDNNRVKPLGELRFIDGYNNKLKQINTDEISLRIRFAPHQKFYQTKNRRQLIKNKYPIITFSHTTALTAVVNGEHNFSKSRLGLEKRCYLPLIGFSDFEIIVGKIWGKTHFPMLHIPTANQSLGYQFKSFNLMNYIEFINDEYFSLRWNHYFKGAIFNKLPVFKHLKVREVIGLKLLYGSLGDKNNPYLQNDLLQLPTNSEGLATTFLMNSTPYLEASVGITNIFKFLRVDLIKRLTYLDDRYQLINTFGVRGVALKFSAKFDF